MVIIFFGFIISLSILNTISNRKHEKILWLLEILIVWFLCVFVNKDYVDWTEYQIIFENSSILYFTKDIGFGVLCYILKNCGFTAISLRIVIFSVGFILINCALNKTKVNKCLFLIFYSFYPLPSDAMHLRTAIVSFLFIYAIVMYIYDRNWVKYIIIILFAASFHKMALLYMPMVLINIVKKNNRLTKIFLAFMGASIIVLGFNGKLTRFLTNLLVNLSNSVEMGNITNSAGAGIVRGWIIDWTIQLMFLVILFYVKYFFQHKILFDKNSILTSNSLLYNKTSQNIIYLIDQIFWINVIALFFLPFYFISFDYFRTFRNMLALNYMVLCIYIQNFSLLNIRILHKEKIVAIFVSIVLIMITGYIKVGYRGRAYQEFYNFFYNDYISIIKYIGDK